MKNNLSKRICTIVILVNMGFLGHQLMTKDVYAKSNDTSIEVKENKKINNKIENGIYTVTFNAYQENKPTDTSMLNDFFDRKAKIEVNNGKFKVTFLNTLMAKSLYDFRLEDNGKFKLSISKQYKNLDMQTFETTLSDLKPHRAGVLVGPMGAKKSDIDHMDKYTKLKIVFDDNLKKGWDGFNNDKKINDKEKIFNKALVKAGLDLNKDGQVSNEELSKAKGVVDLSGKQITDISRLKYLGSDVTELILERNKIEELPERIFDKLVNLKKLYIGCNNIKKIPKGIFDKLTNLTDLSMGENDIFELPEGIFDNLKKLKELGITNTNIRQLPNDIFTNKKSLQGLYLYGNKLENIPNQIENLTELQRLAINENNLKTVPKSIGNLSKLKRLDLSKNNIKEIPMEIYKGLSGLTSFKINHNELTYIPKNIDKFFPKIKLFDFSFNKLKKEPTMSKEWKDKKVNKSVEIYPQKTPINLKLIAKNRKINWKQELSALDIACWARTMNSYDHKIPTSVKEYKIRLNGKDPMELLSKNYYDCTVITKLQKKDSNGEFITIKEFSVENAKDVEGEFNDPNMKSGDQYRIVKEVILTFFGDESILFNTMETTMATMDNKEQKVNKYNLEFKILQANDDSISMASKYVKKVNYEEKDGKKYLILNLDRTDWLKNIKIKVDGKEVDTFFESLGKNNNGEESGNITFEVPNLDSKILIETNVVPMANKKVSFRVIPQKDTLKLIKEDNNLVEKPDNGKKDNNKKEQDIKKEHVVKKEEHIKKGNIIKKEQNNTKEDKLNKSSEREQKNLYGILPKTGSPLTTGVVVLVGTLLSAVGIFLRKKK